MLGLDLPQWQVVLAKYAVVIAVIVGFAYRYGYLDRFIKRYRQEAQPAATKAQVETSAKNKKTRNKPDGRGASGTDSGSAENSSKTVLAAVADTKTTGFTTGTDQKRIFSAENDKVSSKKADLESARGLIKARQGTNFSSSKKNSAKHRVRTVKSKDADESSSHDTATNSSTGQYGDDETSRVASPAVRPTVSEAVPDTISRDGMLEPTTQTARAIPLDNVSDTTGVKDMLEQAYDSPRTISLVGNFQQVQANKQKIAAKTPEPTETKKQRQQRRKREEEKERIAHSNKEHDAKREQQMRGARIAEGTSNQTKANSFKSPSNAWAPVSDQRRGNGVKSPATDASSTATITPLDTFESKPAGNGLKDGAVTTQPISQFKEGQTNAGDVNGLKKELGTQTTSALAASDREKASVTSAPLQRTDSWADQMDEEDQIKLAQENSQKWEDVVAKKDKKKGRKVDAETNGRSTEQVNGQTSHPASGGKMNGSSPRQQQKPVTGNRYGSLVTEPPSNGAQDEAQDG